MIYLLLNYQLFKVLIIPKVYIVGTAHFSKESQDDVSFVIRNVKPDVVMVELCAARIHMLNLDENSLLEEARDINFAKMRSIVKSNGLLNGLFYILMLNMSAKITKGELLFDSDIVMRLTKFLRSFSFFCAITQHSIANHSSDDGKTRNSHIILCPKSKNSFQYYNMLFVWIYFVVLPYAFIQNWWKLITVYQLTHSLQRLE